MNTARRSAKQRIHIQEVGTRDGLQVEAAFIATDARIALVNALSQVGMAKIEVTAFVSPRAIPALRDAGIVVREITRRPGVVCTAPALTALMPRSAASVAARERGPRPAMSAARRSCMRSTRWATPPGVELTPAGATLLAHAKLLLGQLNQMQADMDDHAAGRKGQLRVLANTSAMTRFLPGYLERFGRANPDVRLLVAERCSAQIIAALLAGEADAIRLANNTAYGLLAAVWTENGARQMRVAKAIRAGQVFINCYGAGGGVELPFGGVKKSGHGREKGLMALEEMSSTKTILQFHG